MLGDVLYRLGCVHLMMRDAKDSLESSEKFLQRALAIAEQQCAGRLPVAHSGRRPRHGYWVPKGPNLYCKGASVVQVWRRPPGCRARAVPLGCTVH